MPLDAVQTPRPDQVAMLKDMIANRAWQGTDAERWVPRCEEKLGAQELDAASVNWAIRRLVRLPRRFPRRAPADPVPDGRYMVNGQRYQCVTATDGKWAGWTTVYPISVHGGRGDILRGDERKQALAAIRAVGPVAAAVEFGRKTGKCPYCHQPLADPRSLAAGCGEKCAEDRGIPW